jgi:predicted transposase/invertase (TIGR01784 family)
MAVSHFLDPKNDFIFKKTFGEEKNKDILISFLNDILGYTDGYKIKEVTFLPNTYNPDIAVLRQSIIDVLCTDQNGMQFVVEMQLTKHKGFEKRAILYACKTYSRQRIEEDENHKRMEVYAKLKGVVFLAIANFIMFPEKDAWKSEHHILDKKTYENDLADLKFVFIELPKFKKNLEELENIQEKWTYFFKKAHESSIKEMDKLIGNDHAIQRAFEAIDQAAWSEDDLIRYEGYQKTLLDNSVIEDQKMHDLQEKANAAGKAQGRTEGKIEGKIEAAKNMLSKNLDISLIADCTGLPLEEIKKLKSRD